MSVPASYPWAEMCPITKHLIMHSFPVIRATPTTVTVLQIRVPALSYWKSTLPGTHVCTRPIHSNKLSLDLVSQVKVTFVKRRIIASAKTLRNRAGGAVDDAEADHSD